MWGSDGTSYTPCFCCRCFDYVSSLGSPYLLVSAISFFFFLLLHLNCANWFWVICDVRQYFQYMAISCWWVILMPHLYALQCEHRFSGQVGGDWGVAQYERNNWLQRFFLLREVYQNLYKIVRAAFPSFQPLFTWYVFKPRNISVWPRSLQVFWWCRCFPFIHQYVLPSRMPHMCTFFFIIFQSLLSLSLNTSLRIRLLCSGSMPLKNIIFVASFT